MKRMIFVVMMGTLLAGTMTIAAAQSESLGDVAREARKDKRPTSVAKRYDNDNLPRQDRVNVVDDARETVANNDAAPVEQASSPQPSDHSSQTSTNKPPADQPKNSSDEWKGKIDEQKNKVDLLSRELDVMQREYRLRAAVMYADAGNRLRNQSAWDKEDTDYKDKLNQKQKELDDAKQQLDDVQERARKSGVPASSRE